MEEAPKRRPNKNRLLIKFRRWHLWGGLLFSLLILTIAVTGILINHKDLFFHGGKKEGPTGLLTSTTDFESIPISFDRALELTRDHYGDVWLDKIELKDEHGRLIYKISRGHGKNVRIDAQTGEMSSKYGVSLTSNGKTSLDWGKIVADLHNGKIFGTFGKLTADVASAAIIVLVLTGIYLWGIPLLRKKRNKGERGKGAE